ncbi:MAG: phosphoadenylyl-sulfate reductase [Candidatus Methylacidiphilales bacterium]
MPAPNGITDCDLAQANARLTYASPQERVAWALAQFGDQLVVSSSFGIQAAVTLHLAVQAAPQIPVVFIDTGYHFPETYRFVDELTERLHLNLKVFRAELSPAWQEARFGKLWEMGLEGLERYNRMNKVEPMNRALEELGARAWIAGLRREQAETRAKLSVLAVQQGRVKIHPILEWSNKQVHDYLKANDLPYHPLWEQGYVSVGDVHSTTKWSPGMTEAETRFFGLKRECGLHEGSSSFEI